MTKEKLVEYLMEAVDAMEDEDLSVLFPVNNQPDLYTIANELIGLRGEVKRLAQTSQKLNNNVAHTQQKTAKQWETLMETVAKPSEGFAEAQKKMLLSIVSQDETFERTVTAFKELPQIHYLSWQKFKVQYKTWSQGYLMAQQQWSQLLEVLELEKTGLVGELFNAQQHQAIGTKHDISKPINTILETESVGYLYQNKILKTAKVVVNRTER